MDHDDEVMIFEALTYVAMLFSWRYPSLLGINAMDIDLICLLPC